jgi:hypothetical protein
VRRILIGLIVLATVVFGIAVAFERSNADVHPSTTTQPHAEGGSGEAHTDEGGEAGVPSASESTTDEGTILGVNPEATPIVVLVVIASLALAAAIWLWPSWRWLLLGAAIGMLVFAILDVREVVHQFNESNAGLGTAAIVVTAMHTAAALVAVRLLRQPSGGLLKAS